MSCCSADRAAICGEGRVEPPRASLIDSARARSSAAASTLNREMIAARRDSPTQAYSFSARIAVIRGWRARGERRAASSREASTSLVIAAGEMSAVSLPARAVSAAGWAWLMMVSTTGGPMRGRWATSI